MIKSKSRTRHGRYFLPNILKVHLKILIKLIKSSHHI